MSAAPAFYRRYQDKYDLVNKSYQKILDKTLYTFLHGAGWHDSVTALYQVFQENLFFFQNAPRSHDPNCAQLYLSDQSELVCGNAEAQRGGCAGLAYDGNAEGTYLWKSGIDVRMGGKRYG